MTPKAAISRPVSQLLGCALALGALTLAAPAARADPQASVGLTLGDAGTGYDRRIWVKNKFHLGLHGDVLFGRTHATDFGVGPYAELLTNGFDEIQFGGGVSGLFPLFSVVPVVLSFGGYGRKGMEGFALEPGLTGQL